MSYWEDLSAGIRRLPVWGDGRRVSVATEHTPASTGPQIKTTKDVNKMVPEDLEPEQEDEEFESAGAIRDPLAEPPGSRGRKAPNPYEGTEANDEPGPSLIDQLEDHTPATDEQLEGGEES